MKPNRLSLLPLAFTFGILPLMVCPVAAQEKTPPPAGQAAQKLPDINAEVLKLILRGKEFLDQHQPQMALELFNQALGKAQLEKDQRGEARSWNALGLAYVDLDNKDKALECYQKSLELRRKIGDRSGEAATLNNIGRFYNNFKENELSLLYFKKSAELFHDEGDKQNELIVYDTVGKILYDAGKYDESLIFYEKELKISQEVGLKLRIVAAFHSIAANYQLLKKYEKAINHYQQAYQLYDSSGDKINSARVLYGIGQSFAGLGEKNKTIEYYQKSYDLYHALGDKANEIISLYNVGQVYSEIKDDRKAIEIYMKILPDLHVLKDKGKEAVVLGHIGYSYSKIGEQEKAIEFFLQSLPLYHAVGNRMAEVTVLQGAAAAYIVLGNRAKELGNRVKARDYYEKAIPIMQQTEDKSGEAWALNSIGLTYHYLNEPKKAISVFQKALPLMLSLNDKLGEASILMNMALSEIALDKNSEAIEHLQKALPVFHTTKNRSSEANTIHSLAVAYSNLGEITKALDLYQQSLAIFKELGDKSGEASTLNNIGSIQSDLGNYSDALKYCFESLEIRKKLSEKNENEQASTLNNIGAIYSVLSEIEKAYDFYRQALILSKDNSTIARILDNIGSLYLANGYDDKALEYFQSAISMYRYVGNKSGEAKAIKNIGSLYFSKGDFRKAIDAFEVALPIMKSTENKSDEAWTLVSSSLAFYLLNEKDKSISFLKQVKPKVDKLGDRKLQLLIMCLDAVNFNDEGKENEAIDVFEEVINSIELMRDSIKSNESLKISFMNQMVVIYQLLGDFLAKNNLVDKAFFYLQHAKGRSLLDNMSSHRQNLEKVLSTAEREKLVKYTQQLNILSKQMMNETVLNETDSKLRFAKLGELLRGAERNLSTYKDELYLKHPDAAATSARPVPFLQIASKLSSDSAILDFQITDKSHINLLVLTKNAKGDPDLALFILGEPESKLIYSLRNALSTLTFDGKLDEKWKESARTLYTVLFAPAEEKLKGKKTLIVCPDEKLWDIPFATLLNENDTTLLERFSLQYAASASVWYGSQIIHDRQKPAPGSFYIVANPTFDEGSRFSSQDGKDAANTLKDPSRAIIGPDRSIIGPDRTLGFDTTLVRQKQGGIPALSGTDDEAFAVQKLWPDALVHRKKDAREENVIANMGKFRYVSLATHAVADNAVPLQSYFILADPAPDNKNDGFLTARELLQLDLSGVELAVLSACNTGRGENKKGEGIVGFTWALFAAGCPTQIVSQWGVNDESTGELMGHFYKDLKAGKPKAESLRQAALALKNDGKHSHPYYWAPFILVGDGR